MKVLIVGASGMLAKPVIKHLDNAGYSLRLFSRNVQQSMFDKEYEIVRGNVFNLNDLSLAMTVKLFIFRFRILMKHQLLSLLLKLQGRRI